MQNQTRRKALFFFACAFGAMLLLAAGVARISFFVPKKRVDITADSISPVSSFDPTWLLYVYLSLLALAIITTIASKEGRKRLLLLLAGVASVVLCLSSLPRQTLKPVSVTPSDLTPTLATLYPTLSVATPYPVESYRPDTPAWLVTAVGVAVALLITIGLVLLYRMLVLNISRRSIYDGLSQEAEAALEALSSGGDFTSIVIRCYAQMSQVLRDQRGLSREAAVTPREFELLLTRMGFPAEPVHDLTQLFEQVRYGQFQADPFSERKAVSSLNAILTYCQSLPK